MVVHAPFVTAARLALAAPAVGAALVHQLRGRADLAGVNILHSDPVTADEVRTDDGRHEVIWVGSSTSRMGDVVLGGAALRFDEVSTSLTISIMVLGTDSLDTQDTVNARIQEIAYGVLATIATQRAWRDLYDLDQFDNLVFTPSEYDFSPGRVNGQAKVYGCTVALTLNIRARRSFDSEVS